MSYFFIGNSIFRRGGGSLSSYWATRTPTLLTLSNVGYPEGIKLDWTNAGAADVDGTSIERSADGITYAEIDTVATGLVTYTDSTAVFQTLYYYRVRCYKGTNYSPYSNAESLEVTSDRFIITVDTTKAGSAADTFVLPLPGAGTYDYYVDWGEGGAEEHFVVNTNQTHVYAASGTYQIRIRGTFPRIYNNTSFDCKKILSIDNWGNIVWSSMSVAFYGCSNLTVINAKDVPDLSVALALDAMFRDGGLITVDFSDWDVSNITNFGSLLRSNGSLISALFSNWDTSSATSFDSFMRGCGAVKFTAQEFDLNAIAVLTNFAVGVSNMNDTGTTTNYDNTLISWSAQAVTHSKTALVTNFGTSKYGEGLVDSGTADGTSAGKLVDSTQNFNSTVTVGDVVYNTTDGTYAFVTGIDSDTQLSISADIMASGEDYRIQHSDAAKARAQLVIPVVSGGQGWTLTDGGYL